MMKLVSVNDLSYACLVAVVASITTVPADPEARVNFANAVASQHIDNQDCSGNVQLGRGSYYIVIIIDH